ATARATQRKAASLHLSEVAADPSPDRPLAIAVGIKRKSEPGGNLIHAGESIRIRHSRISPEQDAGRSIDEPLRFLAGDNPRHPARSIDADVVARVRARIPAKSEVQGQLAGNAEIVIDVQAGQGSIA